MSKVYNQRNIGQEVNKNALIFGLISVFLCGIGFGIITPVVPFLVQPYVSNQSEQAIIVALLTSVYAVCVFFVAPVLGVLSDKYGRRPILLICLLGSVIGYLVLGIGGALWILFAGRIIDGITGGNISTIFAYFSDITPVNQRTKYFGWISAVSGVGIVIGPTLGGLLAKFGYSVPFYFGAVITLGNLIYGILYMPESLNKNNKIQEVKLVKLNPFTQLGNILSMKGLKRLLLVGFLLWIPNGSLQATFSEFIMNTFNFGPVLIGLIFSIMGVQDIISQGLIVPKLLNKLSDRKIIALGMLAEIIGYTFIAASSIFVYYPFLIAGMFVFGFGDSIFGPSFNGSISKSVEPSKQGMIQGGSQSIQSLARIIGPIIGGQIYISLGHWAPAFMGIVFTSIAMFFIAKR